MEERRGERRSVKEICTSTEPNGDSTWNYRIELERKYSLNEFIEYVLREKPQEWGSFFMVDGTDTKKYIKELDESKYKKGEIVSDFKEPKNREKIIAAVISRGGWTMTNYYIQLEGEQEKEKPPIDYYMNELKHCIDPMWNPTIEDIKINLGIHDREPEGKAERVKEMIIQKIGPIRRKAETEKIKERLYELIEDYKKKKEIADKSGKRYRVMLVRPGDSLWRIAIKVYRDGTKYTEIGDFKANGFGEERSIHIIIPGEAIFCPIE